MFKMQLLEVSYAVGRIYTSLGAKGLITIQATKNLIFLKWIWNCLTTTEYQQQGTATQY